MSLPGANLNIQDGGLAAGGEPISAVAIIGTSTAGTVDTPLVTQDAALVASTFGSGQLVDAASMLIGAGVTVVCCRATTGTPGAAGSVTAARTDASDGTIVVSSSTPNDNYEVIVEIMGSTDSVVDGDGVFRYSLDNGDTYSENIAIPAGASPQTYAIPGTGNVELAFTDGAGTALAFEVGDKFSFACTAPAYTTAALGTAFDAIVANPQRWRFVWCLGEAADAAGAAAVITLLSARLEGVVTSASQRRYARGLVGWPMDETDANILSAREALNAPRVCSVHSPCNWLSDTKAGYLKRQGTWPVALRWATVPPSEDLGRVKRRALPRIIKRPDGSSGLYRDENFTPGLGDQGITTLRTIPGKRGYFITEGRLLASPTSDFKYTQRGTVMDIACETIYPALADYMNSDLRKLADGTLDPRDAIAIEKDLTSQLSDAVLRTTPQYVSGLSVTVRRDLPNLPADTLAAKFRIQPNSKARQIEGEVSYTKTLAEATTEETAA